MGRYGSGNTRWMKELVSRGCDSSSFGFGSGRVRVEGIVYTGHTCSVRTIHAPGVIGEGVCWRSSSVSHRHRDSTMSQPTVFEVWKLLSSP